ncbi:DNA repair exonuclease SbcCD ATPase subunit [Methylobacterium sp. PvP062]|uniref:DNA repair exonuclease SbcCD ATPase subunit n=1 Tax=Methylobacterium radiotolerans TaxID=31998 RepID=A0ABV2NU28_9HYPH|nr:MULTISPECIES: AAA family ATPase [unclassified Methylobacterium]MBP2498393.1 DNA repair exonuclease SbcCD ATPase subunit [Methylobacterium sp. PvP105]MBP2505777.1 DNA repair exonuclease SbcCD ATPase subunit [Methylobacterium sp. PvP109]
MKILDVEIENFLTLASARVGMSDRGLVLVQGENQADTSADSNGAGKSSFADAVFWCLYGETSRGISGDDVINWAAKKGTRVATRIQEGDLTYTIARHRKHKAGKNALRVLLLDAAGDTHDLTKGTDKLTQALVIEILGASREVFISAVLAGQDQMPDLPGMTDKNLKVIVEEAAGTTVLEKGHKVALTQFRGAETACASANLVLTGAGSLLDGARAQVVACDGELTEWEHARKLEIAQMTDKVRTIVAEVKAARAELTKTDKAALGAQLADAFARLNGLAGEQTEERRLVQELAQAQRLVDAHQHSIETISARARRLKAAHDEMDHQVGCPCGTCAKPYTADDIAPAKEKAAADLRAELLTLRDVKRDHASASEALTVARTALETHRASMTDASATNTLSAQLRASIAAYDREADRIDAQAAQARQESDRIKALMAKPNPHAASKARAEARVVECETAVLEAQKKHAAAISECEIAEEVCKVFAPAGARAEMLDEVTPYLNAQTAKYLGTLSDGNIQATWSTLTRNKAGELKEKFAIEVDHALGGTRFAAISGGEQRKVRIAAALALQDLVASRASKPIPLFVGDEIDNALDPAGVERLTMILQEKARERGTVFIISHSDLKDWVPQVMKVTKTGRGTSTIEEIFA